MAIPGTINGLPVTSIGFRAFSWCTSLASVTIPNSVITIGGGAFSWCTSLTSIVIPDSVITIGGGAFRGCTSLTSVTLPYGVTSIGNWAFTECTSLTAITVEASNPFYSSVDGVLFDKDQTTLLEYPGGKSGSYTIPDSVTSIRDGTFDLGPGWGVFAYCNGLTSVTIPNNVTSIGVSAFYHCIGLTNVTIGNSVTSIGAMAFYHCIGLTNVTIPNSVTRIGGGTFSSCTSLTSVTIGNGVTNLGVGGATFWGCTSLTGVYFKGNAPSIGLDVFDGDDAATVYYLPGTTGWDTTFGGRPTALWVLPYPVILTTSPDFGVQTNQFGFRISWATNASVVIEASPTLTTPTWAPVATNALVNGSFDFSDPQWMNNTGRFYRLRSE